MTTESESSLPGALDKPVPIIFAMVQGVQELASHALNLLGIFDRLILQRGPDGALPETVTLQIVTTWTGGVGSFEQVLMVRDEDWNLIADVRTPFQLGTTSQRFSSLAMIVIPAREGVSTLTVGRGEDELLRQDFTLEIAPAPGPAAG